MGIRKIGGYVALLIGIVLFCYGIYGSYRMYEARQDIDQKTKYVPGEGFREFVREEFSSEVDKYTFPVVLCYIGGVVFIASGFILVRPSGGKK